MKETVLHKQNFIKELNPIEHIVLWLNVAVSLSLFITQLVVWHAYDSWITWLSFVATICSIFSVMAGAKQRILCPLLGVVSSIMLMIIAWGQGLYGSMIMYGLNIIIQALSLVSWIRSSKNKITIEPKHAKWWFILIYITILIGLTALFTWVEGIPGFVKFWSGGQSSEPKMLAIRVFDAANLIFTIGCFWPMFKRYDQVWYLYIIDDIAIFMVQLLNAIYATTPQIMFSSLTVMFSGFFMLVTCILGIINWKKSLKKSSK